VRSQPVVEDGWVYVGTSDGKLVAIDTGDKSLTGWPMWGRDAARSGRK
jgi:outer membrane protein assembly factor BamB